MNKKTPFPQWFEIQTDPSFQHQLEETLNEMKLEQDLVALREARGVSQAQLAKALGVSQPAIAKLESGKAKNIELRTLVRAVSALGGTVRIQITKGSGERCKKVDPLLITHGAPLDVFQTIQRK